MDSTTTVVVVVGLFGIVTPTWMSWWNQKLQTRAAYKIKEQVEETKKDVEETKKIAIVTHALTNSLYTSALKATIVALKGQLVSNKALFNSSMHLPTKEELAENDAIRNQIDELDNAVRNREEQQAIAEAQIKNSLEIPITLPKDINGSSS